MNHVWIMSGYDDDSWMNDEWIINNDEWLSHNSIMIYPWYMVFWIMSDDDADSWMNHWWFMSDEDNDDLWTNVEWIMYHVGIRMIHKWRMSELWIMIHDCLMDWLIIHD